MKYRFSNPPALTSMAHFTFQPRVTRVPCRPIFTWHPHKARVPSYTCKDTQLKISGAKHRVLILLHSWGTEKHTDGSSGNSISALRRRRPQPLRNSDHSDGQNGCRASTQEFSWLHNYTLLKAFFSSLGNPEKVESTQLFCLNPSLCMGQRGGQLLAYKDSVQFFTWQWFSVLSWPLSSAVSLKPC